MGRSSMPRVDPYLSFSRRQFLASLGLAAAASNVLPDFKSIAAESAIGSPLQLPVGSAPNPLSLDHFPDRLHAFIWRNWPLIPLDRLAAVVHATPAQISDLAQSMGLPEQTEISSDLQQRSYITVIRRNWHLLNYEQMLALLGWSEEKLNFTLREDDFLFVKLGQLKPACEPLKYGVASEEIKRRAREIARIIDQNFPKAKSKADPLYSFVQQLTSQPRIPTARTRASLFSPRFCYSYFALYGDPLLNPEIDPYPDGYLERLAASGVNGVWLQGLLENLIPAPWTETRTSNETRLRNLAKLVARAKKYDIRIYIYLNEPRSKPLTFFAKHPELKGASEGGYAAICTSQPQVQDYLRSAVHSICVSVPELGGFFTITGSENLTNCWSHQSGGRCERCSKRAPATVIAEFNNLIASGIRESGSSAGLIAWDWGWPDDWAPDIIKQLAPETALMSVSEWNLPIERGGIKTAVGEYSLSSIGPGPRATRHWELARKQGLKTLAKIQAGNTWELSAIPYIPVLRNVAEHAANLRAAKVDGLMLGWTLGGYPSPNIEVVTALGADDKLTPAQAMEQVAINRFGSELAPAVIEAWDIFSTAFREFPFDGNVVYNAPMQVGPANLLWMKPTGFRATMVGLPYDDFPSWRGGYPTEVFITQFVKMADGFALGIEILKKALAKPGNHLESNRLNVEAELRLSEAAYIHFASVASQTRFIEKRREIYSGAAPEIIASAKRAMLNEINAEKERAIRLYSLQSKDSRIGFEATNHYYYIPVDLMEKVLNCESLKKVLASG